MKKTLIYGTMALLFVLVVCISSAAAVDDTVTRDLPASASAGATITVNLSVNVETGATNYIIDETVPSGWNVTSSTGGGDYAAQTGHVMWAITAGASDIVHSYTVEVPADASGAYTFGDGCYYVFEGMTDTATILGDTDVTVGDVDTVTRDLPASASAGATITVNLSVNVETGATNYIIDETVPSGWNVTSSTGGGDYAAQTGHVMWAITAGASDIVHSYTVEVPADASGAYTFGDGCYYVFEGMTDTATILGDTDVTIGGAAAAPTLVSYTISNTTITPPQTTSIDVEFSEQVSAIIKIEDASGNLVNELYSNTVTDPSAKTWDGTNTTGMTVPDGIYTVNVSGSTTTELSVIDTSKTINVSSAANQAPTAVIASPTATDTYREGTSVSFLSTGSTDPDGTIETYTWDFGDGDTNTSTIASTTHTYTTNGSMTVTLTVTDNASATGTETVAINVYPTGTVVVPLYTGWNLIAVPVNDTSANTAAELALKIIGCKEVVKWGASTQMYVTYSKIGDDWIGTDFAITGGTGIFVNMEGATTVGFTGDAWS